MALARKTALYVDSSVLVGVATRAPGIFAAATKHMEAAESCITSELSIVECQSGVSFQLAQLRKADRALVYEQDLNRLLTALDIFAVDSTVLGRARALAKEFRVSAGLRSLDAIHVATANLVSQMLAVDNPGFQLRYLTGDKRQHGVLTAQGFEGYLLA